MPTVYPKHDDASPKFLQTVSGTVGNQTCVTTFRCGKNRNRSTSSVSISAVSISAVRIGGSVPAALAHGTTTECRAIQNVVSPSGR